MKILRYIALFWGFASMACAVEVDALLHSSQSWDGKEIRYPDTKTADIMSYEIKIEPDEMLSYHCHPVPTLAYVIKGSLRVELQNGKYKKFEKGESFIEVANRWHRGKNLSAENPVELVVFYLGDHQSPHTLMWKKEAPYPDCEA